MKHDRLPLTCLAGFLALALGCFAPLTGDEASRNANEKIASLIQQLGSDDFSQREQAAAELGRFSLGGSHRGGDWLANRPLSCCGTVLAGRTVRIGCCVGKRNVGCWGDLRVE